MEDKKKSYLSVDLEHSRIPQSQISKELFLGIIVGTILDKSIFKKNHELKEFLEENLKYTVKDYLCKSRSLILSYVLKEINKTEYLELQRLKVDFFEYFQNKNKIKDEETIAKWLK